MAAEGCVFAAVVAIVSLPAISAPRHVSFCSQAHRALQGLVLGLHGSGHAVLVRAAGHPYRPRMLVRQS